MKKAIAMLLATVMCTAMLTGCGSDSATNESSQAAESSVAETAALQQRKQPIRQRAAYWYSVQMLSSLPLSMLVMTENPMDLMSL